MTTSPCPADPTGPAPESDVTAHVRAWLERAVIGLNLCPFARAPYVHGRLRIQVSEAGDVETLLADLDRELALIGERPSAELETTLLVHPGVLNDFDDYNDFLGIADLALRMHGLEGSVQIASFHPDYQFADSEPDDIENYTNRAPYPILHILRESSIDAAVAAMPDTDAIYERNMQTLRKLGLDGWQAVLKNPAPR